MARDSHNLRITSNNPNNPVPRDAPRRGGRVHIHSHSFQDMRSEFFLIRNHKVPIESAAFWREGYVLKQDVHGHLCIPELLRPQAVPLTFDIIMLYTLYLYIDNPLNELMINLCLIHVVCMYLGAYFGGWQGWGAVIST